MTTGQRIKSARKAAKMTQAQLAEKLGVPFQSISQWERDIRNPKSETIQRIAEAIGCDIWELNGVVKTISLQKMNELQSGVDSLHYDVNLLTLKRLFQKLNASGQEVALERIKELTEIPRYQRQQEEGEESAVTPQEND